MGKASKDKRDAYYRLAKEQGWRARSAFKLLQLDEHFNLFENVTRVVDLCAAPGSWSQVLSRVLIQGEKFGKIGIQSQDPFQVAGSGDGANTVADDLGDDGQITFDRDNNGTHMIGGDGIANDSAGASKDIAAEGVEPDADTKHTTSTNNDDTTTIVNRKHVRIVAIDLQPMNPLEGIIILQADITHPSTVPRLLAALDPEDYDIDYNHDPSAETFNSATVSQTYHYQEGKRHHHHRRQQHPVDLVISDGAPDVTGLHDFDTYIQRELVQSALDLAIRVLRPGGTFVAKIFRAKDVDLLYAQLRKLFGQVHVAKPRSSRMSSVEAFVVCQEFRGHRSEADELDLEISLEIAKIGPDSDDFQGYRNPKKKSYTKRVILENGITELELESSPSSTSSIEYENDHAEQRWTPPFISCGDPAAFDSDTTYALPKGYVSLDPVQPPTAPPYKMAIEMRRAAGGAYGKTKNKKKTKSKTEGNVDLENG